MLSYCYHLPSVPVFSQANTLYTEANAYHTTYPSLQDDTHLASNYLQQCAPSLTRDEKQAPLSYYSETRVKSQFLQYSLQDLRSTTRVR